MDRSRLSPSFSGQWGCPGQPKRPETPISSSHYSSTLTASIVLHSWVQSWSYSSMSQLPQHTFAGCLSYANMCWMLGMLKWKAPTAYHPISFLKQNVHLGERTERGWVHKTIIVLGCRKWGRSGEHGKGCGNGTKRRHMASVLSSYSQPNQVPFHKSRSYSL